MTEDVRSSLNHAPKPAESAENVALVSVQALPQRNPVAVEAVLSGETESLIVYRDGEQVRAWLNICPHAGRRLDWSPGKFLLGKDGSLICAAHGASFELAAGECTAGPCRGASLRAVAVEVVDGIVRVPA
jgi:nitrite reductase/ring-hydroxylating ferredoxin subunit